MIMLRYLNCLAAVILVPSSSAASFNFLTNIRNFKKDLLSLVHPAQSDALNVHQHHHHLPITPHNFNLGLQSSSPVKLNQFSLTDAITPTPQPVHLVPVSIENGEKSVTMMTVTSQNPIVFPEEEVEFNSLESPLFREDTLIKMFHNKKQRNLFWFFHLISFYMVQSDSWPPELKCSKFYK